MALNAAFIFLVGDADETTRTVLSTPSIALNVVGCRTYAEAESAARTWRRGASPPSSCAPASATRASPAYSGPPARTWPWGP